MNHTAPHGTPTSKTLRNAERVARAGRFGSSFSDIVKAMSSHRNEMLRSDICRRNADIL